MSLRRLQGALLRGTESLWIVARRYSSARAKEEARKRWACEKAELLEVLEARVKQLQANNAQEATTTKSNFSQSTLWKVALPTWKEKSPKHEERNSSHPSRWMEKLSKEKSLKHKRLLQLEFKLSDADPRMKSSRKGGKLVARGEASPLKSPTKGSPDGPAKCQAPNKTKSHCEVPKVAAVQGDLGTEPLGNSHRTAEGLGVQVLGWEDAKEKLPLEEEEGSQNGSIRCSILAYLDCCLFLDQMERAHQCLMFYHRSHTRRKLLDIQVYNRLMRGYAKKGALSRVGQLFHQLEEAGLKPNLESYVTALECLGRSSVHPQVITRCLQQLKGDGFQLEDILRDLEPEEDEVKMALKAIRKVKPDFQPLPPVHQAETCMAPLSRDFYTKERPISYPKLDFTAQNLRKRFREQLQMEASSTVTIDSVEADKPLTEQAIRAREVLATLRSQWRAALLQSLRESKFHLGQRKSGQLNLYPFLCVLKDEEYVDIMMQSLSSLPPQGESLLILARELGTKVYNKYIIQRKSWSCWVEKIQRLYDSYIRLLAKDTRPDNYLPRKYWEQLQAEAGYGPSLVSRECVWPHSLVVQLGLHLVELMVQVLKMESNLLSLDLEQKLIPILYHVYSFRSGRQIGFIRPHPILTRLFSESVETTLTFDSFVIPMLCPPVPWVSPSFGAYILNPIKLMRSVDGAVQHQLLLEKCPRGDLNLVMDALNHLGNCPWKVNQAILDIVISIFNDKGNEKLDIPPPPSEAPQPTKLALGGGPLTKSALKREMAQCRKKAMEMFSLRMDALYKLSIAKHMQDRTFWFPHNMDFRGRTYPCPPHFNHLGSDLTRAILLFAEGKPLGPHGLNWLKIHLINLTGLKKKNSLQDRLAYADEVIEDILDSADYPLTGRKWWMTTDEPWQALACCMEIAMATRSPDPAAYISHFPVHQDGSCNGLQHYAALGRDVIGAASVNLMPSDVPQDVYSGVAQQVEVFRKRDAEEGKTIAQVLDGFIGRKVVKQTVMTVVYGVTRYGGRLQIEKRLKEIEAFPQEYIWEASHYLVQLVFNSLKEMFSGTREIQSWLTESARLIAKSGRTVEWVTPLGLPIVQPYHRAKTLLLNSSMQTVNLKSRHDASQKPDTVKQKNAFPPNFIHSLDSTHMMLTALHCHSSNQEHLKTQTQRHTQLRCKPIW
ncbi:DNA-directed RNA polymerase, mitochondrial isoform X2 [Eublepharis macularius]|uniref:DNA-directed RNA polymerase n=1 Tax=Eublepharis macularius TaxID=481883 RepID=A0AA97KYX4_EUBMA|nr:DNA-directed RNA polymerase, mitochondrial isoform X2 [Eublepharis macularius]